MPELLITGAVIAVVCLAAGYGLGRWVHLIAPRRRFRKRWDSHRPPLLNPDLSAFDTLRPRPQPTEQTPDQGDQ